VKIEKFVNKTNCPICGKLSVAFKLEVPLSKTFLPYFVSNSFQESKHFTNSGIFYVENAGLVATGMFGGNTLQVKCKTDDCQNHLNNFEELLARMG
jgi:hypothetical protein